MPRRSRLNKGTSSKKSFRLPKLNIGERFVLVDSVGDEFSATKGDYFQLNSTSILSGLKLMIKQPPNLKLVKSNPMVEDLPD